MAYVASSLTAAQIGGSTRTKMVHTLCMDCETSAVDKPENDYLESVADDMVRFGKRMACTAIANENIFYFNPTALNPLIKTLHED